MAWIAVLSNDGEEVARFEIEPEPTRHGQVWGNQLERQLPGLIAAIQEAVEKDAQRGRRPWGDGR